jgi:putative tricarboxylic transport membrane protein
MRRHDLISSTIWFCTGLFITLYAPQFDLGTASMPGSGFMPFLAGIFICIFSALTFLQAHFDKEGKTEKLWENIRFRKLIFVVSGLLIYTFFLDIVGFLICTFLLILFFIHFVGSENWLISIVGAVLTSILSYLLFDTWLQANLPKGILGF